MIKDAIRHHSSFNLIHMPTMVKVDIFLLRDTLFARLGRMKTRQQLSSSMHQVLACHRLGLLAREDNRQESA